MYAIFNLIFISILIQFQYYVNLHLCVFFPFRVVGTDSHLNIKHHLTNDDGNDGEDDEGIPPEEASDVISGDVLYGVACPLWALCEAVPQLLHSAALQTRLSVTLSHAWWGRHTGHTRLHWTIKHSASANNCREQHTISSLVIIILEVTHFYIFLRNCECIGNKSGVGFTLKQLSLRNSSKFHKRLQIYSSNVELNMTF